MSPLRIQFGGLNREIGPGSDGFHITPQSMSIYWHGDDVGTAVVTDGTGANKELYLSQLGNSASVDIPVVVAPIERGEPTTSVLWKLQLTRT